MFSNTDWHCSYLTAFPDVWSTAPYLVLADLFTVACSHTGVYYAIEADTIEAYRDYIEKLPYSDEPEIFGMHKNANIAYQVRGMSSFTKEGP